MKIDLFKLIKPIVKTCDQLKPPQYGSLSCKHTDLDKIYESEESLPVDTICTFNCAKGKTLVGSSQRTCLPLAQWDGLKTSCKRKFVVINYEQLNIIKVL